MSAHHQSQSSSNYIWWLITLLGALYLLIYVPQPASIDGDATLGVAQSLYVWQTPTIDMLGAPDNLLPPMSRMGTWGTDGAMYAKKGLTPSIALLPLVALANTVPDVSIRAITMLFNPIITIMTALMLYACATYLGASSRHAFWGALLYGSATMAVPYTQTLFGEPFAGLLLLTALYALLRAPEKNTWYLGAGIALGATVGVNYSYAVLLPFYGLFVLWQNRQQNLADLIRANIRPVLMLVLPVIMWGIALLVYNLLRYGNPFTSGYNFEEGEGFNYPLFWGLFGLWLSPYRGTFWYSPILLWLFIGGRSLWRNHRALFLLVMGVTLAQSIVYGMWWSWHGGIVWAPRFIIPVLPLLMLLVIVSWRDTLQTVMQRNALILLTLASLFVQFLGALIPYNGYYGYLYGNYGTFVPEGLVSGLEDVVMTDVGLSPIIGHARILFNDLPLGDEGLHIALASNGLIHIAVVIGWLIIGFGSTSVRLLRFIAPPVMLILAIAMPLQQHTVPNMQNNIIQATNTLLSDEIGADVVIVAEQRIGNAMIDIRGAYPISTNAPTSPDDTFIQNLWQGALTRTQNNTLAWVTWFAPASPEDWQARHLWQNYAYIDGDFMPMPSEADTPRRYERFQLIDIAPDTATSAVWGEQLALTGYGVMRDDDGLALTLQWAGANPPETDFSFFVHVLNTDGTIIAQQDRQPQGGYMPTSEWTDEPLLDRLYFPTALGAQDAVAIRIGWVDWRIGERFPLVLEGESDVLSVQDNALILTLPPNTR